jgi:hypothetical protein
MNKRTFTPEVIETKENLLAALRTGDIKSSKYNMLNEEEKLFCELVVFGDYSAEQAMKQIRGNNYHRGMGNRMCARPNVDEALEELSYKKNKKFMAEITSARDMALRKATYIMNTSEDESVQLAAAKLILDRSEKATTEKEAANVVNAIQFNIQAAPRVLDSAENPHVDLDAPIILEAEDIVDQQQIEIQQKTRSTGLDFVLNYGNIDNYNENK